MHPLMDRNQAMRGRKRPNRQPRNMNAAKRGRRMSQHVEMPLLPPPPPQQPPEPIEKPDANMCLKVIYIIFVLIGILHSFLFLVYFWR